MYINMYMHTTPAVVPVCDKGPGPNARTGDVGAPLANPAVAEIQMTFSALVRMLEEPNVDRLIRVDYHGSKEVPTGTLYAIAKAAGLRIGGRS
jgi:hypothetical protein